MTDAVVVMPDASEMIATASGATLFMGYILRVVFLAILRVPFTEESQ